MVFVGHECENGLLVSFEMLIHVKCGDVCIVSLIKAVEPCFGEENRPCNKSIVNQTDRLRTNKHKFEEGCCDLNVVMSVKLNVDASTQICHLCVRLIVVYS